MPLPFLQYTTLQFTSMQQLWEFQKKAELRNFHFDTQDCTLRAQLTDKQMELALILNVTVRNPAKSA